MEKKEHSWIKRPKIQIKTDQELIEKKRAQKPLTQEEKVQLIRNRQSQIEREERLEYQKQSGKDQKEGDIYKFSRIRFRSGFSRC